MKLYGAIDLHSTNNVTVVIDEHDQVVYQKCVGGCVFRRRSDPLHIENLKFLHEICDGVCAC